MNAESASELTARLLLLVDTKKKFMKKQSLGLRFSRTCEPTSECRHKTVDSELMSLVIQLIFDCQSCRHFMGKSVYCGFCHHKYSHKRLRTSVLIKKTKRKSQVFF